MRVKSLSGRVFGRLTVETQNGFRRLSSGKQESLWLCKCECGRVKTLARRSLLAYGTESCGCLQKEKVAARNYKHGKTNSYTYKKWQGMKSRVRGPHTGKNACYAGVALDPDWESFEMFLSDMGPCPEGYSLDRIDIKKGYSKENCRWVPLARQATNTSRNRIVVFKGVSAHVSDHAKAQGLSPDVVFDRINKLSWSMEQALIVPLLGIGKKRNKI